MSDHPEEQRTALKLSDTCIGIDEVPIVRRPAHPGRLTHGPGLVLHWGAPGETGLRGPPLWGELPVAEATGSV